MQSLLFTVAGLGLVGISMLVRAAFTAPEGFEDEEGFHALNPVGGDHRLHSAQVPLSKGDVVFFR